jgi:hypothetical protein
VRDKPRIFKDANGWAVELPGYGFSPTRQVKRGFSSHREAGKWLEHHVRHAPSGGSFDRDQTPEPADHYSYSYQAWPPIVR